VCHERVWSETPQDLKEDPEFIEALVGKERKEE